MRSRKRRWIAAGCFAIDPWCAGLFLSPDGTGNPTFPIATARIQLLLMSLKELPATQQLPLAALLVLLLPATVHAHSETGAVGGFVSGFDHPLTGLDHIVAMVAVGLWGAYLGAPAMWLLPVVFPVVMAFGGALGVMGVPMPGVEVCIALSGVALGLMVACAAKPPLWIAAVLVGFFAIFHGHAHGTELPQSANAMTYAIGFVIATGLLHLSGIAFGLLVNWPWGRVLVRTSGAAIACTGFLFLFHVVKP
jgi:urease accessory protein